MHIAFVNIQGNFDPEDRYWTAHPDFGGQLVYVKEVCLALGRMGHKVDILTRRIRDADWPGFESDLDGYPGEPNVRIVRLPCGGDQFLDKQDLWPYIATEWVPNIIDFYTREGRQPDAATSHYGDAGLAAAVWRVDGGPPYTFTAHSLGAQKLERMLADAGHHYSLEALDREYHFARRIEGEREAMSRAARIVTSTHQEREEQYAHPAYVGAINPADDRRFAVVPPGVSLKVFDAQHRCPQEDRVVQHIEANLARDIREGARQRPVVVCSSRLEPKKNHLGLVQAFARNRALRDAANLLLVVRGVDDLQDLSALKPHEHALMEEIVAEVEAQGLRGHVSVVSLESQQELAAAYRHLRQRGSVFALTALYEPFGLAPLEAMAAGLPAVVTRYGGPSETLYDYEQGCECGVLVDATDPQAIARGLLRLVGPANEWRHFQRMGRQRVLERFTWERTAEGYLATLQEILAQPQAPGLKGALPIHPYFRDPRPENDPLVAPLRKIFDVA